MCHRIFLDDALVPDDAATDALNTHGELLAFLGGDPAALVLRAGGAYDPALGDVCLCGVDVPETFRRAGLAAEDDGCGDYRGRAAHV